MILNPVESIFSDSGNLISKKRSRLSGNDVTKVLFLYENANPKKGGLLHFCNGSDIEIVTKAGAFGPRAPVLILDNDTKNPGSDDDDWSYEECDE